MQDTHAYIYEYDHIPKCMHIHSKRNKIEHTAMLSVRWGIFPSMYS